MNLTDTPDNVSLAPGQWKYFEVQVRQQPELPAVNVSSISYVWSIDCQRYTA